MKFLMLLAVFVFSSCQNSPDPNKPESVVDSNANQNISQKINTEYKNTDNLSLFERAIFADAQIIRLEPSKFTELPQAIIKNLEERGCKIPQIWHNRNLHNVIRGEFSRTGQKDWAVLCSINKTSSILIFWNDSTANTAEIGKADDSDYIQVVAENGEMGFSRAIENVDKQYIIDHYNSYGGAKPPTDHEGINDAAAEKASQILYFYRGKWMQLQGAD